MAVKDINDLSFDELKQLYISDHSFMFDKISELQQTNAALCTENKDLKEDNAKKDAYIEKIEQEKGDLKETNTELQNSVDGLSQQLMKLNEEYQLLKAAKYQSQQNKLKISDQLSLYDIPGLFNEAEIEARKAEEKDEEEEYITVPEHARKKSKPKEKHIDYSDLERVVETLPVPEGEDICEVCGAKMHIKKYDEQTELVYEPARFYLRVTRIPVLECVECQSLNEEGKSSYHMVSHPNKLFKGSIVSPELLAYIMDMKYNYGIPFHSLEKLIYQQGVVVPKANMANWVIASIKYLKPLYDIMKKDLISSKYLQADETTTQVLNEENKAATTKSYMFVYRSIKYNKPIVLYDYSPTRAGEAPKEFLKGFEGYLVTDAYPGYNKVDNIVRCMCNVHALRKFKDAYKLLPKGEGRKTSDEAKAIVKYDEIFHEDHKIEDAANKKHLKGEAKAKYIQKRRKEVIEPLFDKFLAWLKEIQMKNAGKSTMSGAIYYTLHNAEELKRFIDDGYLPMDNSSTERAVRPFAVVRNRCKFYVSPKGAEASALIYSMIITCLENRIQPYMYFTYILEKLANMDLTNEDELRELLPYSDTLPNSTKIMSKKEIDRLLKQNDQS